MFSVVGTAEEVGSWVTVASAASVIGATDEDDGGFFLNNVQGCAGGLFNDAGDLTAEVTDVPVVISFRILPNPA